MSRPLINLVSEFKEFYGSCARGVALNARMIARFAKRSCLVYNQLAFMQEYSMYPFVEFLAVLSLIHKNSHGFANLVCKQDGF